MFPEGYAGEANAYPACIGLGHNYMINTLDLKNQKQKYCGSFNAPDTCCGA
jgi:hypothetical protein